MKLIDQSDDKRIAWLDVARGGSILLVVSWHAYYSASILGDVGGMVTLFNKAANPIRMPLFFFCSGILVSGLILKQWNEVIRRRVLPIVWLILVWSSIHAVVNLRIHLYPWSYWDRSPDFFPFFWVPLGVLWFLYAILILVLFSRLVRPLPFFWQVAATIGLQVCVVLTGPYIPKDWGGLDLLFRELGKYAIYSFMAGVWLHKPIKEYFRSLHNAKVAFALTVFPSLLLMAAKARGFEVVGIEIPKIAIAIAVVPMAISLARMIAEVRYIQLPLSWFGRRTLEIFVGHMLFISFVSHVFKHFNSSESLYAYLIMVCVGITGPLSLKWLSSMFYFGWMYTYPAHLLSRSGYRAVHEALVPASGKKAEQ